MGWRKGEYEPSHSYTRSPDREGVWLRDEFRNLVSSFLYPDEGVLVTVELPIMVTHQEFGVLVEDIGLGPFFVRPGKMIGTPSPMLYPDKTFHSVQGLDYETTFTVNDDPDGIVLEVGREEDTDDMYIGFRCYYARGPVVDDAARWAAWQSFGYTMSVAGEVLAYVATRIEKHGRMTHEDTELVALGDDSGLLALVNRGRAVYNTLGSSQ